MAARTASPFLEPRDSTMTLCPVALAVGCKKCPAFSVCPLKGVIGDFKPGDAPLSASPGNPPGKP